MTPFAFEIPFGESRTRFDEELELVRKAWTEEQFTFHGQHHAVPVAQAGVLPQLEAVFPAPPI